MTIATGKQPVTLTALAAVLSLSLVVNLPGLAITPMLSTLSKVFPDTTELEKQLLTILPNLLIIPFVLLSGKLSLTRHKWGTIVSALILFAASAVAYMFAPSMGALIFISCALGCGAGLIIPFSTGLLADIFAEGPLRMRMMGIQSGISNLTLVLATYAVGWLSAAHNWRVPFVVYLVVFIPLIYSWKLGPVTSTYRKEATIPAKVPPDNTAGVQAGASHGIYVGKLLQLVGMYTFITFASMVISYYCPFLVQAEHHPDSLSGTITSIFFLFIFLPGFFLPDVVKVLKGYTFHAAGLLMFTGMLLITIWHAPWSLCVGAGVVGLGYGMCQPLIYDKASRAVRNPGQATMALAIVMTANYVAVVITPFIVDGLSHMLGFSASVVFPFVLSAVLLGLYIALMVVKKNSFAFSLDSRYWKS